MTERSKELEELHWRYDLLGSIEVGIVVLDRDFKVQVWNQFMENHSGILPSQIRGRCLFSEFAEIDQDWFKIKTEPVFNLSSPTYIIWEQRPYLFKFAANRPITSASDTMYQNVTIFPLASLTGKVEQLCVVVYDVTDQALSKKSVQELNKKLHHISRIDGLSGLNNRRYWQEQFDMQFKRLQRKPTPASVIMADIDRFKVVNDTYGHQAGDKVIQHLAALIKGCLRETDIAGRYGGEEFAVLLPEACAQQAKHVAERIRKRVEKYQVNYAGSEIRFTISLGVAEFSASYQTPLSWLEAADRALYFAKESGRNQTQLSCEMSTSLSSDT